jgi:hypothetical protein
MERLEKPQFSHLQIQQNLGSFLFLFSINPQIIYAANMTPTARHHIPKKYQVEIIMKKIRKWQTIYAVCCLIYVGWVIDVGGNEFDRINSQYRRIVAQLDSHQIRTAALGELTAECQGLSRQSGELEEDACSSWPLAVVEAKEKQIEERLLRARERGIIKLVVFYAGFVLIFLLAPPILLYLMILGIIKIYASIKFVR